MTNEIIFNGSQNDFFKTFPIDKRSFDTVYVLRNQGKETKYKFIGSLGENKFTRIDAISQNDLQLVEYIDKIKMLEDEIKALKEENEKIKTQPVKVSYSAMFLNKLRQKRAMFGRKRIMMKFA